MLTAFIVDDEPMARDELRYLLTRNRKIEVIGEAADRSSAWNQIRQLIPDVVFVDIQLESESGLDLAEQILTLNPQPQIVFATAYDEYALKAFELNAIDYLLKPFDEERFRQTIERLSQLKDTSILASRLPDAKPLEVGKRLTIAVEDRLFPLAIDQIYYLSSAEGKTTIVTADRHYVINEPLVKLEQKLSHTAITRVHRAFLANLEAIVEIQPWFHSTYLLMMKDGGKVPVSRTFVKVVRSYFGL